MTNLAALEHPEVLENLHKEFQHAGSNVVQAFTYNGHREKMRVINKEHLLEPLNRAALRIAKKVVLNAKLRNTAICGATETILFHEKIVKKLCNPVLNQLEEKGCKIIGDTKIKKLYFGKVTKASAKDWSKE